MGFFSWKTADTNESIANAHTGRSKPVYLLQPNGAAPILEPSYDGYGVFGGIDTSEWVARHNLACNGLDLKNEDDMRVFGLVLNCDPINFRPEHGDYWAFAGHTTPALTQIKTFTSAYDVFCPKLGGIPNDLVARGELVKKSPFVLKYPLKFSFDPNAVYEELKASERCENQGFFYDE